MNFSHLPDFAYPNDEWFRLLAADNALVREAVYRVRYIAYTHEGVELDGEGEAGSFSDRFDDEANCFSFLLTQNDRPIGSIRANHRLRPDQQVASSIAYQHDLAVALGNESFVESNRFVVHPDSDHRSKKPLLQLMRGVALHLKLTQARYVVTAVRESHVRFYERMLKMHPISGPRRYPGLSLDLVLLMGDMRRDSRRVFEELPELNPSECDVERYAAQVGLAQLRCA